MEECVTLRQEPACLGTMECHWRPRLRMVVRLRCTHRPCEYAAHTGGLRVNEFMPLPSPLWADGWLLACGCFDGNARIWSPSWGELLTLQV